MTDKPSRPAPRSAPLTEGRWVKGGRNPTSQITERPAPPPPIYSKTSGTQIDKAVHKQESIMDEMGHEIRRLKEINEQLIDALENVLTGIKSRAVRIETDQEEAWEHALNKAHEAIKKAKKQC